MLALAAAGGPGPSRAGDGLDAAIAEALVAAGSNRGELEAALELAPAGERPATRWLIAHMPGPDRAGLCRLPARAGPSGGACPARGAAGRLAAGGVFLDAVLPYASVNERRDRARTELRRVLLPLVAGEPSPACAAARLNQVISPLFGVSDSTARTRAEQSPFETIDSRVASCTVVAAIVERLDDRVGASVVSAAGEGEGNDTAAQLMRTIVDAFSQYERALIRQRTRAALAV